MATKLDLLRRALRDERSGRVVFVSHCLLNQNVRYLGGATSPGMTGEVVAGLLHAGVGVVQMPCPELYAWGGVCKRYTMPAYGADLTLLRRLRRPAADRPWRRAPRSSSTVSLAEPDIRPKLNVG